MGKSVIMFSVNALFSALTPEKAKAAIMKGIQKVQEHVAETEGTLDDMFIPASNLVLMAMDIPTPEGETDVSSELRKLYGVLKEHSALFIDTVLDYVEDTFEQGSVSDQVAEKACALIRAILNVPDNDMPSDA